MRYIAPLVLFVALCLALAAGLGKDPRRVPSPLVGKPAPAFVLPQLGQTWWRVSNEDFLGEVWLLNVWASWCVACLQEHPLLLELLQSQKTPLVGLNYKDQAKDAAAWLERWGDPYKISLQDLDGAAGLDWGVYGVPETFVIDKTGVIRHKHIGPLSREDIVHTILPLTEKLRQT